LNAMSAAKHHTHISLQLGNYNGEKLLTSPRSLEACLRLGIDPHELLPRPQASFFGGVMHSIGEMRHKHFEEQRQELIQMARAEWERVEGEGLTTPSRTQLSPSGSRFTPQSGSTPRTLRSPGLRSPEASAARIRSVREKDEQRRLELSQKTDSALAVAEERRRQHVDAQSQSDVVERVAAARSRWLQREHILKQKNTERAAQKLRRIDAQRDAIKENAHVRLIQATESKEMRMAETRARVDKMNSARKSHVENSILHGDARCAVAVQRVEEQRERDARERRLKFEETMIHAAELKAIVEEKQQMEALQREAMLEQKRRVVEDRQKQIQSSQQRKIVVRRHYFEHGECIQKEIRKRQQRLADQRELERRERMLASQLERDMVIEAKREQEEDQRMKCLRARRALDYAESKRKVGLIR
jgi:hypothetical protein